jgi:hypothetical protein
VNGACPKFQLLDIVLASPPETGWRFSGRGWICQVRRYGDGSVAYVVAPLDDEEAVGAVFDENELHPTGERQDAEAAIRVGPFRLREAVTVMTRSEHTDVAGLTGVVVGSGGETSVGVWIDDLGEVFDVPIADLQSTGVRRPAQRKSGSNSLRVNQAGQVLGRDDYVVLQDMDDI